MRTQSTKRTNNRHRPSWTIRDLMKGLWKARLRQDRKIYKRPYRREELNAVELRRVKKVGRLILSTGRKFVSNPREALLLCRMAWWVSVLSISARFYSLPRALRIVAGSRNGKQHAQTQEELARAIDLLLSADVLIFKPICWKRAAVLHRYLLRSGIDT